MTHVLAFYHTEVDSSVYSICTSGSNAALKRPSAGSPVVSFIPETKICSWSPASLDRVTHFHCFSSPLSGHFTFAPSGTGSLSGVLCSSFPHCPHTTDPVQLFSSWVVLQANLQSSLRTPSVFPLLVEGKQAGATPDPRWGEGLAHYLASLQGDIKFSQKENISLLNLNMKFHRPVTCVSLQQTLMCA